MDPVYPVTELWEIRGVSAKTVALGINAYAGVSRGILNCLGSGQNGCKRWSQMAGQLDCVIPDQELSPHP